jgi:hypothetical protein
LNILSNFLSLLGEVHGGRYKKIAKFIVGLARALKRILSKERG